MKSTELRVLSFFVALLGMCYELSLAQFLSVTLGDTFLRYTITVGLFTLTLGITSIVYDYFRDKIHSAKLFFISQILLFLVAFASQFYIPWIAPQSSVLAHLPSVLIGLISGYELPYLIHEAKDSERSKVFAFDYFGMFTATLLFPLVLFPSLGVVNVLSVLGAMNIIIALIFYFRWCR